MASLKTIKELHRKVGELPANKVSDTMRRWYNATTKYIQREERKLACQQAPSQEPADSPRAVACGTG